MLDLIKKEKQNKVDVLITECKVFFAFSDKFESKEAASGGGVSKEEIDEFIYEYGGDRKEVEETLKRRKARLSPEENNRLSILNKRSLNNSLTDSEDIEFDKLVHKYRGWEYKQ